MIDSKSFTKEWIESVNNRLGWNRDANQLVFLEKSIAALHLIEELTKTPLDFIFKGGTSLLLLLDEIYRLSVDADIILETTDGNIGEIFEKLASESGLFTRYEKRAKTKYENFTHYNFYYQPFADDTDEERYIRLDIYAISNPYQRIVDTKIENDVLAISGTPSTVRTPDIDCILGDKLTAFAPETIGIPLIEKPNYRPKRVEFLKQLYDIGNLFDVAENVENIRKTYADVAKIEIKARGLDITAEDTLADTLNYAYIIAHRGKVDKDKYESISKGYFGNKGFSKYVVNFEYDENDAIRCAAKIAYLVKIISGEADALEKYDKSVDMTTWEIKHKGFESFNEYKFTNPQAFYYFCKALGGNE